MLLLCSLKLTDYSVFPPEITMARLNLSGMTVEALMDVRKRLTKCFLAVVPRLKSSWRRWIGQLPWSAAEGLSEAVEAH